MSDSYLCLFPSDPNFIPSETAQEEAKARLYPLISWPPSPYPGNGIEMGMATVVTEQIEFIHPMQNLHTIACHLCGVVLDNEWWGSAMSDCYSEGQGFTRFDTTMPCCGVAASLHDLDYQCPAGFGRFRLLARAYHRLLDDEVTQFEAILGCSLRKTTIYT